VNESSACDTFSRISSPSYASVFAIASALESKNIECTSERLVRLCFTVRCIESWYCSVLYRGGGKVRVGGILV